MRWQGRPITKFEMLVTGVLIQPISPARSAAFDVLAAVEKGAYATDSLLERCRDLSSRDAGLASQIAFGCLRYQAQLDYLIQLYSGRNPDRLDLPVLIALRTAIFQLRYLERVPAHAAVHESVEMIKRSKIRSAAGLVNAVLRKVNRNPVAWPDLPTELSCPAWLLNRWTLHFGAETASRIAHAALEEPQSFIRVAAGAPTPPNAEVEPTAISGCFRVLSGMAEHSRLQDISSQAIIPMLDLQPNHSYLDVCAAPGNKTLQALEHRPALAIACDISVRRIREIPPVCPRVVLDGCRTLPFRHAFDRVFVDAPCSGTGTLARNPEIKWRVTAEDFVRFQSRQIDILTEATRCAAEGAKVLYATCSLEPEENQEVVAAVLSRFPNLRETGQLQRIPGADEGDGFFAAVLERGGP